MTALLARRPSNAFGAAAPLAGQEPPTFICQQAIGDYCYGPGNGNLILGSARPIVVTGRFAVGNRSKMRVQTGGGGGGELLTADGADLDKRKAALLAALDKATAIIPGDDWLAGFRVWFASEFEEWATADRAAQTCGAERWWCDMLRVYVHVRRGDFESAEPALDNALREMPAVVRCQWDDVSRLLRDGGGRARFERMTCAERASYAERFWWLADPFFAAPGNERRVEQFAREVHVALLVMKESAENAGLNYCLDRVGNSVAMLLGHSRADSARMEPVTLFEPRAGEIYRANMPMPARQEQVMPGQAWRPLGLPELFLRGGLPDSLVIGTEGSMLAMYPTTPHAQFTAATHAVDAPFQARSEDWNLLPDWPYEWVLSNYGPFVPIEFQMARFRRGDSTRLVAVTDVSSDPRFTDGRIVGALAFSTGPRAAPIVHLQETARRFVFSPLVPTDSAVVSLEVQVEKPAVAWARFGFAPLDRAPNRIRLSDLLLYDVGDGTTAAPASLDEVFAHALATTRVTQSSRVGVYWEIYGLRAAEAPAFTISARRKDTPGVVGSAVRRLFGSSAAPVPLRLTVQDRAADGRTIEPRVLTVDLSALDPGRYVLSFTVSVPGETPAVSEREFDVVKRP